MIVEIWINSLVTVEQYVVNDSLGIPPPSYSFILTLRLLFELLIAPSTIVFAVHCHTWFISYSQWPLVSTFPCFLVAHCMRNFRRLKFLHSVHIELRDQPCRTQMDEKSYRSDRMWIFMDFFHYFVKFFIIFGTEEIHIWNRNFPNETAWTTVVLHVLLHYPHKLQINFSMGLRRIFPFQEVKLQNVITFFILASYKCSMIVYNLNTFWKSYLP